MRTKTGLRILIIFLMGITASTFMWAIIHRHGKPVKLSDVSAASWNQYHYDGNDIEWLSGGDDSEQLSPIGDAEKGKIVITEPLRYKMYIDSGKRNSLYAVRIEDRSGKYEQNELKEKYIRYVCTLPVNVFLEEYNIYLLTEEQIRHLSPLRDAEIVIIWESENYFADKYGLKFE